MTDATRRKLTIPNWYPPYLEKHRIYELFHELARELVIQQPTDHILFLKQLLFHATVSKDAPRIILLAPPQVNVYEIARKLSQRTRAVVITERDISSLTQSHKKPKDKKLVKYLSKILRTKKVYESGWILPDFPKTWQEAKEMQHLGILPTHVFQLIPPFSPSIFDLSTKKVPPNWIIFRRAILGLRDIFKYNLKELYINEKRMSRIVDKCMQLMKIKKRYKAPIIPRICILGPRGSGRKTQAKLIAKKFNLVHVDFEYILTQNWLRRSYMSFLLKAAKDKLGEYSVLLAAVVHKRILKEDCLERGWVLTGFPNTVNNLKHLDMIDTPPNRIIFLEADLTICRKRILNRRINMHTGSETLLSDLPLHIVYPNLQQHPKDKEEAVNNELTYYCEHYNAIRKYCGATGKVVDANQPIQWILEIISSIIMRPMPDAEPRCPCPYPCAEPEPEPDNYISEHDFTTHSGSCVCEN